MNSYILDVLERAKSSELDRHELEVLRSGWDSIAAAYEGQIRLLQRRLDNEHGHKDIG